MAESSLYYKGWSAEFEVADFALAWLVIETVLDADSIRENPAGLQGRIQHLIDKDSLGDDWYHVTHLDPIIGNNHEEFNQILGRALSLIQQTFWEQKDLWTSLKYPDWTVKIGMHSRFGRQPNFEAFLGMFTRFVLPALAPESDHAIMTSLGWIRLPFWGGLGHRAEV